MSAPRRWLDDGGGSTPSERDLLRSAGSMEPPADAQRKVWAAIAAQLPPPPGPASGAGGAAGGAAKAAALGKVATGGAAAGILKSALIGAGGAVLVLATHSVLQPSTPPSEPKAAPPIVATVSTEPAAAASARLGVPAEPPAEPAVPATASASSTTRRVAPDMKAPSATPREPMDRESALAEESRLVAEAQTALRDGDAPRALARLEEIRVRFPGGVLAQEREALTIEALARSGRRDEASTRANAFLKAHPTSTLAPRIAAYAK